MDVPYPGFTCRADEVALLVGIDTLEPRSTWYAGALFVLLLAARPVGQLVATRADPAVGFLASSAWTAVVTGLFLVATPLSKLVRFGRLDGRRVLVGLGAGVLLFVMGALAYVAVERVFGIVPPPEATTLGSLEGGGEIVVATLAMAAVVVAEEAAFRGVLLGVLRRGGAVVAPVLLSAAAFAVYHLSLYQVLATLIYGIAFAALTVRSGGLGAAVVAHLTLNGLGFVLSVVTAGGRGGA